MVTIEMKATTEVEVDELTLPECVRRNFNSNSTTSPDNPCLNAVEQLLLRLSQ